MGQLVGIVENTGLYTGSTNHHAKIADLEAELRSNIGQPILIISTGNHGYMHNDPDFGWQSRRQPVLQTQQFGYVASPTPQYESDKMILPVTPRIHQHRIGHKGGFWGPFSDWKPIHQPLALHVEDEEWTHVLAVIGSPVVSVPWQVNETNFSISFGADVETALGMETFAQTVRRYHQRE